MTSPSTPVPLAASQAAEKERAPPGHKDNEAAPVVGSFVGAFVTWWRQVSYSAACSGLRPRTTVFAPVWSDLRARSRRLFRNFLYDLGRLVAWRVLGYVSLGYDTAATSLRVHDRHASHLIVLHDLTAVIEAHLWRNRNDVSRHTVSDGHLERILSQGYDPATNVAIGYDAKRFHAPFTFDYRDAAAIVIQEHFCNFLQLRLRCAIRRIRRHDLSYLHDSSP
jgi:hypothetical protein